jgi:hypothetical protein
MAGIERKSFDRSDEVIDLKHGRMEVLRVGDEEVWRSDLAPGWSWDEDLQAFAGGASSCPMTHREYVVAGSIRYLMDDGQEVTAKAGDQLFIPPGHRGWVVGDENCVLIDW